MAINNQDYSFGLGASGLVELDPTSRLFRSGDPRNTSQP